MNISETDLKNQLEEDSKGEFPIDNDLLDQRTIQ